MYIQPPRYLVVPGLASLFLLGESVSPSFRSAYGQIVPDSTLGAEPSLVTPDALVRGDIADLIEGGATRGSALFHSFQDFNVNGGQRVYFANPTGIENILSRVTGLNASNIDGLLGVDGAANLFLLNPNGIIFGPNARLDVDGAFLASTSDRFLFADGTKFRATDPNDAPLVTVNIPLGLQLGPDAPAALVSDAELAAGTDLTLSAGSVISNGQLSAPNGTVRVEGISGDVQIQAVNAESAVIEAAENLILNESELVTMDDLSLVATDTVRIRDTTETPFVASAGGDLLVEGAAEVDIFALNHPDSGLYAGGDLVLRSSTPVIGDAHYLAYDDFRIENMSGSLSELISPNDPIIRAAGNVEFTSYTGKSLHILAGGSVTVSGSIKITGRDPDNGLVQDFELADGTDVSIDGQARPTLDIRAGTNNFAGDPTEGDISGIIDFNPPLETPLAVGDEANISIGSIEINGRDGQVFLTTMFAPNALAGGNVIINGQVADSVGPDSILAPGDDIRIATRGDIFINPAAQVDVSIAPPEPLEQADGGNIVLSSQGTITTGFLRSRAGNGNGGGIDVDAIGNITIDKIDSRFSDSGDNGNTFDGGNVNIQSETGAVTIAQNLISQSAKGDAGNVIVIAAEKITTSAINSKSEGDGSSGFIFLISENNGIEVTGDITSDSQETAGSVNIRAGKDIIVDNVTTKSSGIDTDTGFFDFFDFDDGGINISSSDGLVETGNLVTSTFGNAEGFGVEANSGNVVITAKNEVTTRLISTTAIGDGGNSGDVKIESQSSNIEVGAATDAATGNFASIVSFSQSGTAGKVNLTADEGSITVNEEVLSNVATSVDDALVGQVSGNVTINARDDISVQGIITKVETGAGGSGTIFVESSEGAITNKRDFVNNTEVSIRSDAVDGTSGNITLLAKGDILTQTDIKSSVVNAEKSGNIELVSSEGSVTTVQINDVTGDITVQGNIQTNAQNGDSGTVFISASKEVVTANVITEVAEDGNSGTIEIVSTNGGINTAAGRLISESGDFDNGTGTGDAANVTLTGFSDIFTGDVVTQTNKGKSGEIIVSSKSGIVDTSAGELVSQTNDGLAGDVTLTSPTDIVVGSINSSTAGDEAAATIKIGDVATDSVTIKNGTVRSSSSGAGASGSIIVQGKSVDVTNATVETVASGEGSAGSIDFTVQNGDLILVDSFVASTSTGETTDNQPGEGGSVVLTANTISATNSLIEASAQDNKAGKIDIAAANALLLQGTYDDGDAATVDSGGVVAEALDSGVGGSIAVTTPTVAVKDGASIRASATGNANAGSVAILDSTTIALENGAEIATQTEAGDGNPDGIQLGGQLQTLTVINSEISASTETGKAGGVTVNAADSVTLNGLTPDGTGGISASAGVVGEDKGTGGSIVVNTTTLDVQNGAAIAASAQGGAEGGAVLIDAQTVTLNNNGGITAETQAGDALGEGIQLNNLQTLEVNSSLISASTETGKAGGVTVNATDSVTLNGIGGISASAGVMGEDDGTGGNVLVKTNDVVISNGAAIAASAIGKASGGAVSVEADRVNVNSRGQIAASTQGGNGNPAGAQLNGLRTLVVDDGLISTSTTSGKAGGVTVNAANSILLSGRFATGVAAGVSAEATAGGDAGDVKLTTSDFQVRDGAAVTVSSPEGLAGSLSVIADQAILNRGTLASVAGKGDGSANITVDLSRSPALNNFLRLDNESLISASALGEATGGNITIKADFIFATFPTGAEGSDIAADAQLGSGGAIDIEAPLGVFGLQVRPERTPLNDITATGGVQGSISISTLTTSPDEGVVELDLAFVDVSDQTIDRCATNSDGNGSEINVAGRGGLPPMPTAILSAVAGDDDWVTLASPATDTMMAATPTTVAGSPTTAQLTPASSLCHRGYQASQTPI